MKTLDFQWFSIGQVIHAPFLVARRRYLVPHWFCFLEQHILNENAMISGDLELDMWSSPFLVAMQRYLVPNWFRPLQTPIVIENSMIVNDLGLDMWSMRCFWLPCGVIWFRIGSAFWKRTFSLKRVRFSIGDPCATFGRHAASFGSELLPPTRINRFELKRQDFQWLMVGQVIHALFLVAMRRYLVPNLFRPLETHIFIGNHMILNDSVVKTCLWSPPVPAQQLMNLKQIIV